MKGLTFKREERIVVKGQRQRMRMWIHYKVISDVFVESFDCNPHTIYPSQQRIGVVMVMDTTNNIISRMTIEELGNGYNIITEREGGI